MALIVRNTFLDIAEHKPFVSDRRCHSLPRHWNPATPRSIDDCIVSPPSPDASTRASLRSDFSFFSEESGDDLSPTDDSETDSAAWPSMNLYCKTPTSSVASPRACGRCDGAELDNILCHLEPDNILCYLANCSSELEGVEAATRKGSDISAASTSTNAIGLEALAMVLEQKQAFEKQEQRVERDVCTRVQPVFDTQVLLPNPKKEGPTSQSKPLSSDTRADAIANAVYSAIVSCGRAQHVEIARDFRTKDGKPSVQISAKVESGLRASSQPYDVVQVAKQALEAAVAQTKTVKVVSARVQKEDGGYSLRSSLAFVPEGVEERLCWDMFQKGYCNRGLQCRWNHFKNSQYDIARIKVSVRRAGEASDVSSEEQLGFKSSTRSRAFRGRM